MSEIKIISRKEKTEYIVEEIKEGEWKRFEVVIDPPNYHNIFYMWWVHCECDEFINQPFSIYPRECRHTNFVLPTHVANYEAKRKYNKNNSI